MLTICRLIAIAVGGLAIAACQTSESSVANCYGVAPASGALDQCAVVRTTTASQYQTSNIVAENQLAAEVRSTCLSYGLQPGSELYTNCLVREADNRRPTSYAGHFARPGERYDQHGRLVDAQGYLIDRDGRRIGGRGYWVSGPGTTVPPGTYVSQVTYAPPTYPQVSTAPQQIVAAPRTSRPYPFSNTTAFWQ